MGAKRIIQRIKAGNAIIRLDPRTPIIVLPTCASCGELAPDCHCGLHTFPPAIHLPDE